MKFAAVALPVFAAAVLGAMPLAMAEDAPATGVPELSIAQNWNDPVRAAFAQRGITYGVNWSGEYWNVVKDGNSTGSYFDGLLATYTDIDLEKLVGWKGGAIHASAYYLHGVGPSTDRAATFSRSAISRAWRRSGSIRTLVRAISAPGQAESCIGSLAADSEFFISDKRRVVSQRHVRLARRHGCQHGGRRTGLSAGFARRARAVRADGQPDDPCRRLQRQPGRSVRRGSAGGQPSRHRVPLGRCAAFDDRRPVQV